MIESRRKKSFLRHAMDFPWGGEDRDQRCPTSGSSRTSAAMVAEIQARNGGRPITDADRETIALKLQA